MQIRQRLAQLVAGPFYHVSENRPGSCLYCGYSVWGIGLLGRPTRFHLHRDHYACSNPEEFHQSVERRTSKRDEYYWKQSPPEQTSCLNSGGAYELGHRPLRKISFCLHRCWLCDHCGSHSPMGR